MPTWTHSLDPPAYLDPCRRCVQLQVQQQQAQDQRGRAGPGAGWGRRQGSLEGVSTMLLPPCRATAAVGLSHLPVCGGGIRLGRLGGATAGAAAAATAVRPVLIITSADEGKAGGGRDGEQVVPGAAGRQLQG